MSGFCVSGMDTTFPASDMDCQSPLADPLSEVPEPLSWLPSTPTSELPLSTFAIPETFTVSAFPARSTE